MFHIVKCKGAVAIPSGSSFYAPFNIFLLGDDVFVTSQLMGVFLLMLI